MERGNLKKKEKKVHIRKKKKEIPRAVCYGICTGLQVVFETITAVTPSSVL